MYYMLATWIQIKKLLLKLIWDKNHLLSLHNIFKVCTWAVMWISHPANLSCNPYPVRIAVSDVSWKSQEKRVIEAPGKTKQNKNENWKNLPKVTPEYSNIYHPRCWICQHPSIFGEYVPSIFRTHLEKIIPKMIQRGSIWNQLFKILGKTLLLFGALQSSK